MAAYYAASTKSELVVPEGSVGTEVLDDVVAYVDKRLFRGKMAVEAYDSLFERLARLFTLEKLEEVSGCSCSSYQDMFDVDGLDAQLDLWLLEIGHPGFERPDILRIAILDRLAEHVIYRHTQM